MVYEFESGPHKRRGVDPQRAGDLIARLADRHGGAASGPVIVDAARSESSVIHGWFNWNDADAAEEHRRWQAGDLVRSLVVIEETPSGDRRRPAYFHVNYEANNGHKRQVIGYQPVQYVIEEPDAQRSAAEYLLRQLEGLQRRADQLDNLGDVFSGVWAEVGRIREQFDEAA